MFSMLSGGRMGHTLGVRTETQARALFSIYAIGFTAIAMEIQLLFLRAWRLREPLRLNELERFLTRADIQGWAIPVLVGNVTLVLARTLPLNHISWSGWIYLSMAILVPLHRRFLKRRRPEREK